MNKQLHTWGFIYSQLLEGKSVMLLYVVESIGSSPGRQGFFMAVTGEGKMAGSIGGGIMEHKFVEMAKELLVENSGYVSLRKQYHHKKALKDQSGMICSGEQSILVYQLLSRDINTIAAIVDSLKSNTNGYLTLSSAGILFGEKSDISTDFSFKNESDANWQYTEKTGFRNCVHIIGGGHCALALSQFMSLAGFYVMVYDDRKSLHTLSLNSHAHTIRELDDYSVLGELIPDGKDNQYVVVMTFGYRTDRIAMRALMFKNLKYLGLLGSENKIREMVAGFRAEGISERVLERIHSPAGIRINSREPEEIAISIAAEIIKVKNSSFK